MDSPTFGALIVAKKKTELTHGWLSLVELLFVALGVGLVVAGPKAAGKTTCEALGAIGEDPLAVTTVPFPNKRTAADSTST